MIVLSMISYVTSKLSKPVVLPGGIFIIIIGVGVPVVHWQLLNLPPRVMSLHELLEMPCSNIGGSFGTRGAFAAARMPRLTLLTEDVAFRALEDLERWFKDVMTVAHRA